MNKIKVESCTKYSYKKNILKIVSIKYSKLPKCKKHKRQIYPLIKTLTLYMLAIILLATKYFCDTFSSYPYVFFHKRLSFSTFNAPISNQNGKRAIIFSNEHEKCENYFTMVQKLRYKSYSSIMSHPGSTPLT